MHPDLSSYHYHILTDDQTRAGFVDCVGLDSDSPFPGGRLTLFTGVIIDREFYNWMMEHSAPRPLRVVLFDKDERIVNSWGLINARVSKVTATTFTGGGFPFRLEALELAADEIQSNH